MRLLLTLAWRNLWRHPRRTWLTASVVGLGLALLLVFLGLGDGGHYQMIESAVRMGSGHVLLQAPGYQERRGVEMILAEPAASRLVSWAGAREEVAAVLPRAFASGLLSSADGATGVGLVAVDAGVETSQSRFAARVTSGRFVRPGDRGVVAIGVGVARVLKAGPGSRVVVMAQGPAGGEIHSALLRVVGVIDTGLDDVDETLALVPLSFLQEFLGLEGGVHQVALLLDDQGRSRAVARAAGAAFPDIEALTWAEADPQLEAFIKIDDGGGYLTDGIFFLLIAFTVLNTLLMSVLERRREFALLGALGLPARQRGLLLLLEGAFLATLATAGGLGLGLAGHTYFRLHGLPLEWFTSQQLEAAGVVMDPVMYSVLSGARIVGALALVFALTVLLTLVAARHAAKRVDPNLLKSR